MVAISVCVGGPRAAWMFVRVAILLENGVSRRAVVTLMIVED
jgi:hypothetical protein